MGKKFFMKMLLVALFIALPFTSVASACLELPDSEDLVFEGLLFEGELMFDFGGCYFIGQSSYPLDLHGLLEVSDREDRILGDLHLDAQKISEDTYKGDWSFFPSRSDCSGCCCGCCCGCDLGLFELSRNSEGEVSFILNRFLEVDQMIVSGLIDDDNIFNGSMVPIPGALLLFGSGLLGLICIRRK